MNQRHLRYCIATGFTKHASPLPADQISGQVGSRLATEFLLALLVVAFCSFGSAKTIAAEQSDQPNILWISCEDISSHLGCYGAQDAKTPHIDALADRGLRFTHAFTTCPVCATNRSSIITGMYPTTIGTHLMRCNAKLPSHIRCFTEYLREAGYFCTNDNKTDYNFPLPRQSWDRSRVGCHWRDRPQGTPFFHVRNFVNTHESRNWPRGDEHLNQTPRLTADDRRDPAKITLPPYHADTPETRRDWANYHENITELDYRVRDLLDELEADGLTDDTIIFFWSDHGVGLPRGKRWLYDSGTRVPLIVVIPERFRQQGQAEPSTVTDELISFIDLAPTVLNLCGVEIPDHMQGRSFLGKERGSPRGHVVSTRDRMDERYDIIRTVRDHRWRYTRNFMPWKPYLQWLSYAERNNTMKDLRLQTNAGAMPSAARLFMSERKPIEELYDTVTDPHELHNLAESTDPEHQEALQQMRATLQNWQAETHDLGFLPEYELDTVEQTLGSRFEILRTGDAKPRIERLRAILSAVAHADIERLEEGLQAVDAAERYWAVVGIGRVIVEGNASGSNSASDYLDEMRQAALDSNVMVRIAAAENLCRLGTNDEGLAILAALLTHEAPSVRLAAATSLDELDEIARPVMTQIEAALATEHEGYFRRVAGRALKELNTSETASP